MTERQFHKDEVIFRQGDVDYSFFRILEGSVGIFSHDSGQEERKLTELTEGQTFGEMAVIDCYPRSATAIALTEGTRVYQIDKDDLSTYLKENPELMLDMIRFLSDRLRDLTNDYSDACAAIRELKRQDARTVPIFAMTASTFEEGIRKSLESGMDAFITKPLDVRILQSHMRKFRHR